MDEREAELLELASPMHDIGKVAISDSILNKPQPLLPEEKNIMNNHPTYGFNMLRGSKRKIMQAAATVAHEHHEKFDGTGYPRGLKAQEIHIFGRITAIADVFDALSAQRVYKKSWPDEKIWELLEEEKGKHFDPKLIELFFDNIDDFLEIREQYKD